MPAAAAGAATTLDSTRHESAHRFPCFLPDGDHFLYVALPGGPAGWDTYVGSLRTRAAKRLLTAESAATYAEPGYLLFRRNGKVMARRFDAGRLELSGDEVPIADAAEASDVDAEPVASASRNGRLAIMRSDPANTRLELVDTSGATKTTYDLPPGPWKVSSIAPDGRRAAVFNGPDLWIVDLERSVPMRFATSTSNAPTSVWSPDGGQWPRWVDGGRSLRYGNSGAVVTVPVTEGEELTPGTPHQVVFSLVGVTGATALPDGNLHLVSIAMDHRPPDIRLILDWTALLRR